MFQKQFSLHALGAIFAMALGVATGGAQAEFKVFRGPENTLRYIKDPCKEFDTVSSFFLHVFPVLEDDLPLARRVFGFDNLDFSFKKKGILLKGACFATVQLPDYEIASIETGQKKSEDKLWKVKITRGTKYAKPTPLWVVKTQQDKLHSHLYSLNVQIIRLEERFAAVGGAIAALHNELLVATPRGKFVMIGVDYAPRRLTGRVPMNESALVYHETQNDPVFNPDFFRVVDVLLKERSANRFDLFVSHSYFTGECVVLRLSATTLSRENGQFEVSPSWRTIFDDTPCLSFSPDAQSRYSSSGGILLADGPDHLLLTVGDFGINEGEGLEPRNPDVHFGKIMRIAIETGQAEVVSQGHRNPGGLARDQNGNLWMTEHGPKGGDELNLIQKGNDYGWPLVSYGIGYDGGKLPRSERPLGSHDHFARPVFAWVPSIGVSNLVVNDEQALPLWKDDLLVASLGVSAQGRSIFRIRHHNQKVDYVERIIIGLRIRDITQASGGRLALLNDRDGGRVLILQRSECAEQGDLKTVPC